MPSIEDIRINGQTTTTAPTIAGLHPVIGWDYEEDEAAFAQYAYSLRIGTNAVNLGTSSFSGSKVSVDAIVSSSNFFEYVLHNLDRGVTYFGQVKAFDPDIDETPWATFSFVTNNLPFVTSFSLSPASPETSSDIELSYTYNDVDGHDQAGTKIRWFKNNTPVSEYDDLCILPAVATAAGESWSAKIVPSDGLEFGPIVETGSVTIQDVQSFFETITILPADGNVDDMFKAEWTLTESEYILLTGTVSFEWLVNEVPISNSDTQFIRLNVDPGDLVSVSLTLTQSDGAILAEATSEAKAVLDVDWHVFNFTINELKEDINISDLSPVLEWDIFKSTADPDDVPAFFRVMVTKTPSVSGPIYDTGEVAYTKDSFVIPSGILSRGQNYFVHIGTSDVSPIPSSNFIRQEIDIFGSSWNELVSNSTGWTIETKLFVELDSLVDGQTGLPLDPPAEGEPTNPQPRMGVYIHDGTRFCSVVFEQNKVVFHSDATISVNLPLDGPDLGVAKTFRISGQGDTVQVFMNNNLLLDATGAFTNSSQLKFIEYGDIDGKYSSTGVFLFFRYSTLGSFGVGSSIQNENTYYFFDVGQIDGGQIQYVESNLISWLPDDTSESAKLLKFNEASSESQLPTTAKNFSPITTIAIDKNRNKYIGTANGANAIYGEKHDPDYEFLTSSTDVVITTEDFDRITTVDTNNINSVETDAKLGWFTIDTTFRTIGVTDPLAGFDTGDPYDPYKFGIDSHAIHYYSQRTHGHSWYDMVDNEKGWQLTFSFQLDHLEQDDFEEEDIDHQGFGVYINDGTYQEILYFYQDRIRLFYANVFVPIVTSTARKYRIVGKGKDLLIYQKLDIPSITSYQLIMNASGLFTTAATISGNSRRPSMIFDTNGLYHAVWNDDGNARSQIFYSVYDGSSWSNPELVANSKFDLRNPSISVDSSNRIWVVYEDTSWGQTEISVSVRDEIGWNLPTRITNIRSNKSNPNIEIDAFDNVHVVWEDDRNGPSQIFWAQREKDKEAWISSGQFGEDAVIMQQRDSANDPYLEGAVQFKKPKLAYDHPRLWMVCEVQEEGDHTSSIYRSSRNVETETWQSMGVPIFNSSGTFVAEGTSVRVSLPNRNSVNPTMAVSSSKGMVVAWEDQTEPVSQIWGASYNVLGTELTEATQITSRLTDCKHPAVGWVSNQAPILFESDDNIRLANYDGNFRTFNGSATGDTDALVQITGDRRAARPAIANSVPSTDFRFAYEFLRESSTSLDSTEFPDYYLIGDASVSHVELDSPQTTIITSTLSDGLVSNIDTKEFAFGDMSETISMRAHWKDIQMYFGYDAKPHAIAKFNSSTVFGWGDDRVNDIFVDTFGNIILAKYDGLFYHNVFTGELTNIEGHTSAYDPEADPPCTPETCLFRDENNSPKVVTAVKWGGNGAWYVGTTDGLYLSTSAGKIWSQFDSAHAVVSANIKIHAIAVDPAGNAVCATSEGVVIAKPDLSVQLISIADGLPLISGVTDEVRAIGVDENNVIWAGGDRGLIRIENKTNFLFFNKKSGMRASYVTDIAIVNKHLRFVSTPNGIDKMHGTTFSSISTQTHELLNNNIAQIFWESKTQSLWAAGLHTLHEIVFRDPAHDIIQDEIVQYDSTELLTDSSFETDTYTVLDIDELGDDLDISPESTFALINKNKIDFGFSVGELGKSVTFSAPLLPSDEVEILVSNRFVEFHDFNQTDIEQQVVGTKRTGIKKIVRTFSQNQTLLLSGEDKHQILLLAEDSLLPFTTVLLDRDLPIGCLQQIDTLTPTTLKFKIFASDEHSGVESYILSNYENFTNDGETPLDYTEFPSNGIVTHNIGSDLNNVTTSLTFPTTVTLPDLSTTTIGNGAAIGKWTDISTNNTFLMAGTSNPPVIWKFDPSTETWTAIAVLGSTSDTNRSITRMQEFNNVLYVATRTVGTGSEDLGVVYKTTDGINFDVASTTIHSRSFRSITAGIDGTMYFGDGTGNIYTFRPNADQPSSREYSNIGDTVESLSIWNNLLVAGTGINGRIYLIDTETGSNIIVFTGNESAISNIHIKDSQFSSTREDTIVYASSSDFTTIYRADLESFDFLTSFNSVNRTINKLGQIDRDILQLPPIGSDESTTQAVAAMGDSLFKHNVPSWEFFYLHDEDIGDFIQYSPGSGHEGIYLISDNKVTKWTNQLNEKTVYLSLRDKAGNLSAAPTTDTVCPDPLLDDEARLATTCCTYAYSLKISDLANFINESRIVDITNTGNVVFTYNSPTEHQFYSGEEIDEETGIYTSDVLNGSNELVSWKTITWTVTEPSGTSVDVQIRSGATQDATEAAEWTPDLVPDADGFVSIEHITDQYLQFRIILKSRTRGISPTLTSVTLRNLTTQASHFFTTNFIMPSRVTKGLLTANTFIPVSADIVFGINTKNSVDFGDYQIIEPNRLFTSSQGQFGEDFRIGVKLLSPGIPQLSATTTMDDPYDVGTFVCAASFSHQNSDITSNNYHFRIQFYNDTFRTQLIHTFFSGNDQTGWSHGSGSSTFPANGLAIAPSASSTIQFEPLDAVESNQRWYVTISAWDGSSFETVIDDRSYICSACNITNDPNLVSEYYKTGLPSALTAVPRFSSFTPDFTLLETDLTFAETNIDWTTSKGQVLSGFTDNFAARFHGKIQAPTAGSYTFELQSSDGSILFIDAEQVINHDGTHGFTTATGSIFLTEGFHDIDLHYFEATGSAGLELRWITPGESTAVSVPHQRFFHAVANEYCDDSNSPILYNFAMLFELDNGETVKINLDT